MPRPLLAISAGDPVGIGPEVVLKACLSPELYSSVDVLIYGDSLAFLRAGEAASLSFRLQLVTGPEEARRHQAPGVIPIVCVSELEPSRFIFGHPNPASDRSQADAVLRAFADVAAGRAEALVTAPISKESLLRAGLPFPGHTELLADLCRRHGLPDGGAPVMMIAGPRMKVVPLTVHLPLSQVAQKITPDLLLHTIRVTHRALARYFGVPRPRIAIAGLNPHAGENGLLGDEEKRAITPGITASQTEGMDAQGPYPADTVFRRTLNGEFDAVIGMYHDQALIPAKLLDFDQAVNVTLGLPLIRTSVDHGTAYDIAGRGSASAGSMLAALRLAAEMSRVEMSRVGS